MIALLTILLLFFQAAVPDLPKPFPREGATQVFDNARATAWDVTWPKNKPTQMHRHVYDLVGIELADATFAVTSQNGSRRTSTTTRGRVLFLNKNTVHMEEGLSDIPRHAILIDLKDDSSPVYENKGGYPSAFPREGAKKLLENQRVTIWDYSWVPGKPVPMHFHDKDVIVVFMEPGELKSTTPDGQSTVQAVTSGQVLFSPGNRAHTEGLASGAVRAIIVELK